MRTRCNLLTLLCGVVLTNCNFVQARTLGQIVNTTCGEISGNVLPGGANEYLGIPFAFAERYAAPVLRTEPFDQSPLDATYYGPACLQTLTTTTTYGKEHCLVMNVWAPQNQEEQLLPILVYIYGGSNDFGEAEPYNSSQLAVNNQAIVFSFNYRTGPLGFLAFSEEIKAGRSSGNYALQDIQAALGWVQREAKYFGGDKSKIAIFGQSSGAGLVQLQLVIPSSSGLFQGIISQSGGLSAQSLTDSLKTTLEMHKRLNCTERGFGNFTLKCLQNTSAEDIVIAQATHCVNPNVCTGLGFGPVVDGILIKTDPLISVQNCQINQNTAILYGLNTNDSYLFIRGSYWHKVSQNEYIKVLNSSLGEKANQDFLSKALKLYPPFEDKKLDNLPLIGWFSSDRAMCENRRLVHAIAKCSTHTQNSFVYRYNYWFQSNKTCTAVANYHDLEYGSMHQDEVSFVFGQPIFMNIGYTNCSQPGWSGYDPSCLGCVFNAKEQSFSKTMGTFWTNFASSQNPNHREKTAQKPHENEDDFWPSYSESRDENIVLEPSRAPYTPETMVVESALGREEFCDFWDLVDS